MVEYNDELTWPDWLDAAFFIKVLRTYKHDQTIKVNSYEISPGTGAVAHFASVIYKAVVVFSSKKYRIDNAEIKMVMKLFPTGDNLKARTWKDSSMFKNEIRMYTSVIPEMERILEQAGEKITLAPPLIYQSLNDHPSPVIILKDVSPEGFSTPPWGVQSYETVKVLTRTIARFHAASMLMLEQGADFEFGEHFFLSSVDGGSISLVDQFMKPGFFNAIKGLETVEGFEEISKKLIKNLDSYFDILKESYRLTTKCGYKVLNHGDFHSKNILVRNGAQTQEDLLLIDYQFPVLSTPAIDVYYLINMMTNPEIRGKYREEIYKLYFNEFVTTLKKIGYRGRAPTLLDFRIEMLRWSVIDLIHSISMVSMQFIDPSKFDYNKMAEDPEAAIAEAMQAINESESFKQHVRDTVKRLLVKGTLG